VLLALAVIVGIGSSVFLLLPFLPKSAVPGFLQQYSTLPRGVSEFDWIVRCGIAAGVGLSIALLAWVVSLSPRRQRRPHLWLYLLGFSWTIPLAAFTWVQLDPLSSRASIRPVEAFGIVFGAACALPCIVFGVEWLLGSIMSLIAQGATRVGWLGFASFFTRQWQRFRPDHPDLTWTIGLLDFDRGHYELAFPRLVESWTSGRGGMPVVEALWEIVSDDREPDLVRALGEKLIERGERLKSADIAHVRKRLGRLAERQGRMRDALDLLAPVVDSDNPADLEEIARLQVALGRWSEVTATLVQLEQVEGPPRSRSHQVYQLAIGIDAKLDDARNALIRQHIAFALREGEITLAARSLEMLIKAAPDDKELRRKAIPIYRQMSHNERVIEHQRALLHLLGVTDPQASALAVQPDPPIPDDRLELALGLMDVMLQAGRATEAAGLAETWEAFFAAEAAWATKRAELVLTLDRPAEARGLVEIAIQRGGDAWREKVRGLARRIETALDHQELDALETRLREHPDDGDSRLELIRRLVRRGRAERAALEADALLEKLPDWRDKLKAELESLVIQGRPVFLIANYLAELYLRDASWDKAHDLFGGMAKTALSPAQTLKDGAEKILAANPDHLPSHLRALDAALQLESWDAAALHGTRARELGAVLDTDKLIALFDAYCICQDIDHGVPLGKQLLDEQPYVMLRVLKLAQLYIDGGRSAEALELLNRAKQIEPGNPDLYAKIDVARVRQREHRLLELRDIIDKEPTNAERIFEMGDLLLESKRLDDAIRLYQRAGQAADTDEGLRLVSYTKLAWCMSRRRMYDTAVEALRDVPLRLSEDKRTLSERKRLVYEIAELLEENNQFEKAGELYKQVFKVDAGFRHVMDKVEKLTK